MPRDLPESSRSKDVPLEDEAYDDDLPMGHPLLRLDHEVCFLPRSTEMDMEEEKLRFALLAAAPGEH